MCIQCRVQCYRDVKGINKVYPLFPSFYLLVFKSKKCQKQRWRTVLRQIILHHCRRSCRRWFCVRPGCPGSWWKSLRPKLCSRSDMLMDVSKTHFYSWNRVIFFDKQAGVNPSNFVDRGGNAIINPAMCGQGLGYRDYRSHNFHLFQLLIKNSVGRHNALLKPSPGRHHLRM